MAVMLSCSTDDFCRCSIVIANSINDVGGSFVIEDVRTDCNGTYNLSYDDLPYGSYAYGEPFNCKNE